jgi:hypothetical protein
MKHKKELPDERIIGYDSGKAELKIVLVDCKTEKTGEDTYSFTGGRIELYHRP